jgi:hypothetical protein
MLGGLLYYLPAGLLAARAGLNVLRGKWSTEPAIHGVLMAVRLVWALFSAAFFLRLQHLPSPIKGEEKGRPVSSRQLLAACQLEGLARLTVFR